MTTVYVTSVLVGVALGSGLGLLLGRKDWSRKPSVLPWTALALTGGIVLTTALGFVLPGLFGAEALLALVIPGVIALALSAAALVVSIWAVARRPRGGLSWTALIVTALPALFWLAFLGPQMFSAFR
ncbi:hypothetical protein P0L94_09315 [Microbacter sp. GSS18]|nr:hypothetical protein P0L94_09315 [Microbacter sp. GSS18]